MNLLSKSGSLSYTQEGKILYLEGKCSSPRCSWSIFDIGGTEKCNGVFTGENPYTIDITCLKTGLYEICVMDGEQLRKARLKV